MTAVAERADGTLVVTLRLTLKPGRDDELIMLIRSAPPRGRAAAVREAMRGGVGNNIRETIAQVDPDLSALGMDL